VSAPIAPDDIVENAADAQANSRPPLLVLASLRAFLDAHGLGEGEIVASPIGEGHSNVTYLIERGGRELVLRRPPRGPLPPSAHDVLREARLLRALKDTSARVPDVLAVCEDPDTIGAPFYVMERVDGEVIVSSVPPALDEPSERRRIGEQLIDALVEIHAVDWSAVGLEGFGKPTGYLQRQLRRFGGLWELNKTREIPAVERVAGWLAEHLPSSGPATVVHGDYRLGNTMFAADAPARLTAVLDWEMATIGDVLADLTLCTLYWRIGAIAAEAGAPFATAVVPGAGYPDADELVEHYATATGTPIGDLGWYDAFAAFKLAVILEGVHARYLQGATVGAGFESIGALVPLLAAHGRSRLS